MLENDKLVSLRSEIKLPPSVALFADRAVELARSEFDHLNYPTVRQFVSEIGGVILSAQYDPISFRCGSILDYIGEHANLDLQKFSDSQGMWMLFNDYLQSGYLCQKMLVVSISNVHDFSKHELDNLLLLITYFTEAASEWRRHNRIVKLFLAV
jgi:hypothetical protein